MSPQRKGRRPIAGGEDAIAQVADHLGQELAHTGLVIDDQDRLGAASGRNRRRHYNRPHASAGFIERPPNRWVLPLV
ncbi:MAG TPA: hypothetical protein VGU20_24205 [Stellaceae bacterium]|nr:hypothetical protein [Stellaceae bacterium]